MSITFANGGKLVQLLGKVPRIILLILKTNDLSTSIRLRPTPSESLANYVKLVASMRTCTLEKGRFAIS